MRSLHVIPSVAPRYGGPSQAVFNLSQALQERDVEVLIATTDADGPGELQVELGQINAWQNIPAIFFHRQWSEAVKFSRPLSVWLQQHVGDFDLVHIHAVFSHACIAAARACRRRGIPYIVRPLGTLDPWSLQQKRTRKRLFWHMGVKQMLADAVAIHYTTHEEQRLVESSLGLERGVVIPLGTDESLLQPLSEPQTFLNLHPALRTAPYVIVLCRLHPKKRLELFLEVFLDLTSEAEYESWKLVVVGDGETDYVRELQALTAGLGGKQRVTFTGWLTGEAKKAALQGAQLYALPSRQENFGISVVEAMACSLPVLISEHVNLAPEVIEAQAGWVTSLEKQALAETLRVALRDQGERIRRGARGRELVCCRFTWPAVAEQVIQLYKTIVGDVDKRVMAPMLADAKQAG